MAIQYRLDDQNSIIVVVAEGHVETEDRWELVNAVQQDPAMPARAPVLIDVGGVSNIPSEADLSKMSFFIQLLAKRFGARIAYLVTSDRQVSPYAFAAYFASQQRVEAQAFTDREIAIAWLKGDCS